jgi:hypothetical protein
MNRKIQQIKLFLKLIVNYKVTDEHNCKIKNNYSEKEQDTINKSTNPGEYIYSYRSAVIAIIVFFGRSH